MKWSRLTGRFERWRRVTFPPMATRLLAVVLLLVFVIVPLEAQQLDSGTVNVTVREAMGMVDGLFGPIPAGPKATNGR
jgi:hypothetical protein